jgi:hypothetical protein
MQVEAKAPGEMPKPFYLQRRCAGVIASLAWSGLGVQLYFDIQEALIKNQPVAGRVIDFFSYFTIETNILIALVLTIFCTQPQAERFLTGTSFISALVVYIIVVGVVYELLLRHLWHPQGMQLLADIVLHDAVPFLYSLYWLMFISKGSLRWSDSAIWLLYPVVFFLYSMFRGVTFGIYPYPFINADQLGFERVFENALIFLAVFYGLGAGLTLLDHALGSDNRGRSGLGRAAEL